MPKDLRWKVVLIVAVLLFACVAVYPTEDTLMWHGKVTDTVNNRGGVDKRELIEKTVDNKFAYWADKLTFGIFHHKKEAYGNKDDEEEWKVLHTTKNYKVIERDVVFSDQVVHQVTSPTKTKYLVLTLNIIESRRSLD